MFVCLKVEFLVDRPGGIEAVSTSNTLGKILCRCSRVFIAANEHKNLWLVTMSQSVMRDLLAAHQSGLIDTKHPSEVSDAIKKAFPTNRWDHFVLSYSAQKCLDDCGLGYRDVLFPGRKDLVNEFLPDIAERFPSQTLLECLYLVEDMITTHTQQIFDSGLVAALVEGLDFDPPYDGDDYTPEERPDVGRLSHFLGVLTKLLKCGDKEVEIIVDLGFVCRLKTMLSHLSFGESDAINIFDALKSIVKTSPLLRDKVLQSKIVTRFSKRFDMENEDIRKSCVDLLKAMLCNKDMTPVEYSNLHLDLPDGSGLLSLNDFEVVEFIGFSLCSQIETQIAEYHKSYMGKLSLDDPSESILKLLNQPSAAVKVSAIGLFSSFAKLDREYREPTDEVDSDFANEFIEAIAPYLDNESDDIRRKACVSLCHVFQHWRLKYRFHPFVLQYRCRSPIKKRLDIFLKWINTLSTVLPTNSPPYEQKLIQYLSGQIQNRMESTENAYKWLLEMDTAIKTMSYDELSHIGIAHENLEHSVSVRVQQVRIYMSSLLCLLNSLGKYLSCQRNSRS